VAEAVKERRRRSSACGDVARVSPRAEWLQIDLDVFGGK
jgi:hypothetical protein